MLFTLFKDNFVFRSKFQKPKKWSCKFHTASTSGSRKRKATVASTFIKAYVRDCIAASKIMPQLPSYTEHEDTKC